ncbi:MAG: PP2C family protein-serine/threonine phosphatase, partial [Candidatus Theseobacter exili]|nr:PP2C family protein-serine/threonine phosphatase [Candidatus Theseobacter exili]
KSGQQLLIENALEDSRIPIFEEDFLKVGSLMAVPLKTRDSILGVMVAVNKIDQPVFTDADISLFDTLASQAAVSVAYGHLYNNLAEKERLDRELQIAKEIQNLLLPKEFPILPGFDISAMNEPALEVGGDYFDFLKIDDHRYGIVIADVSGKGVPAALVMVMCRSILRSISKGQTSSSKVLSELNSLIHPDLKSDMFVSVSFLILNTQKRVLTIARAGHEPLLLYNQKTEKVTHVTGKGIAIGIDKGPLFVQNIEEIHFNMGKGDFAVLYTDGISEAIDENNQEFGRDNLINAMKTSRSSTAGEIVENICERIKRFTGDKPQRDDLTLVVIKAT